MYRFDCKNCGPTKGRLISTTRLLEKKQVINVYKCNNCNKHTKDVYVTET